MEEDFGVLVETSEIADESSKLKRRRDGEDLRKISKKPKIDVVYRRYVNVGSAQQSTTVGDSSPNESEGRESTSSWKNTRPSIESKSDRVCLSGTSTAPSLKGDGDDEVAESGGELPVWKKHNTIIESIKRNQITVIVGETGSGKTTQIPQMLLSYFETRALNRPSKRLPVMAITQPRRVAAISLAGRVLSEIRQKRNIDDKTLKVTPAPSRQSNGPSDSSNPLKELGGLVGYSVRFQSRCSHSTQIKFLTDGMILREALVDPLLRRYNYIIIDEAHERTIQTDILLGLVKTLFLKRPSLRVIVMSATLDYRAFTAFFGQGEVVLVPGRQHPVSIYHTLTSNEDYMDVSQTVLSQSSIHRVPYLICVPESDRYNNATASNKTAQRWYSRISSWTSMVATFTSQHCLIRKRSN